MSDSLLFAHSADSVAPSAEQLRGLYATMWRIRLFEQQVLELFSSGTVRGTAHLYVGEEAVATGACAALRSTDYVTSTHRGHGHALAKGLEPGPMLAEIIGRATGYCKGKGGSMHVASAKHGMLGADGIVGGGTPIAVGAALGAQILGRDDVVLCFFGDGASNQGVLFESLNLASVRRLPVIFLCENNLWALTTPARTSLSVPDVATRGQAFNIPGFVVDGQDVLAVHEAVSHAAERGRAGEGPTLLECKTYRYHSHSAFATREVRAAEEIAHWKARDPISLLGGQLRRLGIATEADLAAIQAQEEQRIRDAVEFALHSPLPDVAEAFTDVLADATVSPSSIRGEGGEAWSHAAQSESLSERAGGIGR
ncbi:MAG: thiamine pyrophosphate-dependent dehydrogenase E1 component subunit alpha [Chloroflexi bacterium]|nr:thiamine pyrophosphate-dependent dehydrogenase E1 component subunit alpha [Chloroflexota bacterium]